MRQTALLVIISFLWTTTFAPVAMAVSNDAQTFRQRGAELMATFENAGWHLEVANHQRLSTEQWLAGASEYDMVPPSRSNLADLVFHVRSVPASDKLAKFAFSIRDRAGVTKSRRLIEIDPTQSATDARIRLEQTVNSMVNDLQLNASAEKPRSFWQGIVNWLLPSAYASEASNVKTMVEVIYGLAAVGIFSVGYLLIDVAHQLKAANQGTGAMVATFVGIFFCLVSGSMLARLTMAVNND